MQGELNKQLLEAIRSAKDFDSSFIDEIKATNECEKICLKYSIQLQIDLLKEVGNTISTQSLTAHTLSFLIGLKNEKQEQLNNLK